MQWNIDFHHCLATKCQLIEQEGLGQKYKVSVLIIILTSSLALLEIN